MDSVMCSKKWSQAIYMELLRPEWFLHFTNPDEYEKKLKVYKKVRSMQRIKRQAFFM